MSLPSKALWCKLFSFYLSQWLLRNAMWFGPFLRSMSIKGFPSAFGSGGWHGLTWSMTMLSPSKVTKTSESHFREGILFSIMKPWRNELAKIKTTFCVYDSCWYIAPCSWRALNIHTHTHKMFTALRFLRTSLFHILCGKSSENLNVKWLWVNKVHRFSVVHCSIHYGVQFCGFPLLFTHCTVQIGTKPWRCLSLDLTVIYINIKLYTKSDNKGKISLDHQCNRKRELPPSG